MKSADVLVVDDSPDNLAVMCQLLEAHGARVRTARGGVEALEEASRQKPDLVLLDLQMPDLDGFEVCRRLHQEPGRGDVPVLFVSAAHSASDKVRAFALGAVDYVTKPFQFEEVLARVQLHLELKRLQAQAVSRATELEAAQAKAKALEEQRARMVAALVHDLKNPLTPILINSRWLLNELPADAAHTQAVRDIYVSANHLHRMVLSMLDVARGSDAQLQPSPDRQDVATWLDQTLSLARLQLRDTPDRLVALGQAVQASFDGSLLARVVQNLVDNALKHSTRGAPSVTVTAEVTAELRLRVAVEDHGPGVPAAERARIFEPWVRLPTDQPSAYAGHGLGLAFCMSAVTAHGGTLRVEDVEPHGARFVFEVPAG